MPDTLGRISIPEITAKGVFPLRTDFQHGRAQKRSIVTHQFGDATGKIEQSFYAGFSAPRYTFKRNSLRLSERKQLAAFWESQLGSLGAFFYDAPQPDQTFVTKTVYFENAPLSFEQLTDAVCTTGLTLVEIPDPADAPSYDISNTLTRFPDGTLASALCDQVQEVIPLIRLRVAESAVPDIYLSDRRVTVGDNLYLPRLLRIGDKGSGVLISQSIDGSSDDTQFAFGNADRAMVQLANDTELKEATIQLSLFHVASAIKLDLWAGEIVDWASDQGPEFTIQASDIISALTLQSPVRNISRTCWRIYADSNFGCPVVKTVDTRDLTNFPSADMSTCDLGYDTANGCLAHTVAIHSFGGQQITPQSVTIRDNSTGTWGFGRDLITPTSQINDSAYGGTLPEIWHNDDGIPQRGLPVQCRMVDGREESDFYEGMGIVGRGPIGAYTVARMYDSDGDGKAETFLGSTLDGQPHHGFKQTDSSGSYTDSGLGLRQIAGNDPAGANDYFSLDRGAGTPTSFREVVVGGSIFLNNFVAGVAFLVIRRTDQKGVQLSDISTHQMTAMISQGLTGYVWDGGGTRSSAPGLTNPFWVAVNTLLRSKGVDALDSATQQQYFDLASAVACGSTADTTVNALFGGGTETQFRFKGSLDALKPLRDRLTDILNNGLGYYTWSFGKLKLGCRSNATAVTDFSSGSMLMGSLKLAPIRPQFEKLTISFADTEYLFEKNTVDYCDQDYALRNNRVQNPKTSQLGLLGSSTKSQTARIAVVRTREELGGVGETEQKNARMASWSSTILGLDTEAGQVVGIFDPDLPGGYGKFRIQSWRLNRDWSLDIEGKTVTDSMYDLTQGTVAVDIAVTKQPTQADIDQGPPPAPVFSGQVAPDDATAAEVYDLSFATTVNTRTITAGTFTFYYDDPTVIGGPTNTKVVSTAWGYDFFDSPYSAAELAWVLKTSLPGMHVSQIDGYVTNSYGDSPVTTVMVNLTLAGLPKSTATSTSQYLQSYSATTGTFVVGNFADDETPSGTANGTNATFTLAHSPNPATSLLLLKDGVLQVQGLDYSISGSTITFLLSDPNTTVQGDTLRAFYRY